MSRLLKSKVLDFSIILRLFSAFGLFFSLFVVVIAPDSDSAQGRCLVGGRYTPFLMIAAISRKKGTHTGFTNDNKTITKTITFGIKNGPCETLPFLSFSSPFPFPFPFLFLSLSFPFLSFPSFTIPFPFPFPRSCEFFDQGVKPALGKTIRGKKTITSGKTIWKGSGFLQTPI